MDVSISCSSQKLCVIKAAGQGTNDKTWDHGQTVRSLGICDIRDVFSPLYTDVFRASSGARDIAGIVQMLLSQPQRLGSQKCLSLVSLKSYRHENFIKCRMIIE